MKPFVEDDGIEKAFATLNRLPFKFRAAYFDWVEINKWVVRRGDSYIDWNSHSKKR